MSKLCNLNRVWCLCLILILVINIRTGIAIDKQAKDLGIIKEQVNEVICTALELDEARDHM